MDSVTPDPASKVVEYPINSATGRIENIVIPDGNIGEEYKGNFVNGRPIGSVMIPADEYDKYLSADGKLVNASN